MTERSDGVETILKVGAEGGSIKRLGRRGSSGEWQFQLTTGEEALSDLLDEEPPAGATPEEAPWTDWWDGALARPSRYPWPKLYPLAVHTDFAQAILDAVNGHAGIGRREVNRWKAFVTSIRSRPIK